VSRISFGEGGGPSCCDCKQLWGTAFSAPVLCVTFTTVGLGEAHCIAPQANALRNFCSLPPPFTAPVVRASSCATCRTRRPKQLSPVTEINGEHLNALPVPFDLNEPTGVRRIIGSFHNCASRYGNCKRAACPLDVRNRLSSSIRSAAFVLSLPNLKSKPGPDYWPRSPCFVCRFPLRTVRPRRLRL